MEYGETMAYFPFFVDIKNMRCLVVGGGKVALRKIQRLTPFGVKLRVCAPDIMEEISEAENTEILRREFMEEDLDTADLVVSATGSAALGEEIYRLCMERKIPVNTVDDPKKCSFIFPSLVTREDVTVGISTGGKSPVYAKYIRRTLEKILDERRQSIFEILSDCRPKVMEMFAEESRRADAMNALLEFCLLSEERPQGEEINLFLEELCKKYEDQNRQPQEQTGNGSDLHGGRCAEKNVPGYRDRDRADSYPGRQDAEQITFADRRKGRFCK